MKTKQQLIKEFVENNTLFINKHQKALELAKEFLNEHLKDGQRDLDFWGFDEYGGTDEYTFIVPNVLRPGIVWSFINGNYFISQEEAEQARDAHVRKLLSDK